MAESCRIYPKKQDKLVLHGRIVADILGAGRIIQTNKSPRYLRTQLNENASAFPSRSLEQPNFSISGRFLLQDVRRNVRRNVGKGTELAELIITSHDSVQAITMT